MKTPIYAAAILAALGTAPVMAQAVQPVAPEAAAAAQAQPNAPAWETAIYATDKRGEPNGGRNAYGQPNQIYGMPGGDQASPSSHAAP
jgi:hypothetical protein